MTVRLMPNACDHFSRGALRAQEWRGVGNGARIVGGALIGESAARRSASHRK